jgi:uncharacterized MAPEG superfamily protein
MVDIAHNPSFLVYSVSMLVLCFNVLALWGYSGFVRARSKTARNPEDVGKGTELLDHDPPEVARVLRAHRNATDNILPFAVLAFLLVLWGASPLVVGVLCGIFTVARLAHSLAYLGEKQPWRTIFFGLGGLTTFTLMGFLVKAFVTT